MPAGKAMVEAEIGTDRVERGITQTDSKPSVQAALGYRWPQFKAGVWGSNFKAAPSEDNVNVRIFGAYRFIFTSNADMTARLDVNRYAATGSGNGNIMSLDIQFYGYHVDLEQVENWEGTGDISGRFGFRKEYAIAYNLIWGLKGGFNQPAAANEYFDFATSIGVKVEEMRFDLIGSVTSGSILNGRGKPAVYLTFSVAP